MKHINTISDLVNLIEETKLMNEYHSHLKVWFRGHADNKWKLEPGVYRKGFIESKKNEDARLNKEQHLSQDFKIFSAGMRVGNETDAQLYFFTTALWDAYETFRLVK